MQAHLPLSFADDLEHNANWFGQTPAYVQDDRQITHAQLLVRARQLASALHTAGTRRQERVAMLAMNCIEFGEVMAATQWGAYILAGLNWRLAPPEMRMMLEDSSPAVLIFEAQYLPVVEQLRAQLPGIRTYVCIGGRTEWAMSYEDFVATGDPAGPPQRAREDDIACLIYTSGTTGRPKGCIWGHREYRHLAQVDAWLSGVEQTERGLIVMPMFHIGGMLISLTLHVRGGTVFLHRQFEPGAVIEALDRDQLTFLLLAPTMVQMVMEHPAIDQVRGDKLRTLMYSAAPMPLPVLEKAMAKFGDIFVNLYGQSEICMYALTKSQHKPSGTERERQRLRSVGNPYPNLQSRIVDEQGSECPRNVPGEITARFVAQFRGYWNNHAATLETVRDGWIHTGDMGYIDDDGFLFLVDRKKDMILSGGENIYSREVEEAVLRHPAVAECAVIGLPDPKWGENVCALIVLRPGTAEPGEQEVIDFTKTQIASYKKPKRVIVLATLPKLVTGKIDKKLLRQQHAH
ncbi:MAG: putative fatty-acid--CoA ligase [Polaromonas sp.]|nr:putative fatty-acid--CoA ligase [Polaromonas sp.]